MKCTKVIVLNILLSVLCFGTIHAETPDSTGNKWEINVRAGYSIGATVPWGLPDGVTHVNSFSPKPGFRAGLDLTRWLNNKIGVRSGVYFERKSFGGNVNLDKYEVILVFLDAVRVYGNFTGKNVTNITQTGLTIPLQVTWRVNRHARLSAGPYFSLLTGRTLEGYVYNETSKTVTVGSVIDILKDYINSTDTREKGIYIGNLENLVELAPDKRGNYSGEYFDKFMRRFQWGIDLGFDYYFTKRIGAFANLTYGLNSAFSNEIDNPVKKNLYPLYFTLGVAVKLN